jgi:hypothetical protein
MQLTGTIYSGKHGTWSMWTDRRAYRATGQTATNVNHPGQQEEPN